jgi:hypothetical protein
MQFIQNKQLGAPDHCHLLEMISPMVAFEKVIYPEEWQPMPIHPRSCKPSPGKSGG